MEQAGGEMNGLDLFTGYGGITLALEPWVRPVAYCEKERYAQAIILSRIADGQLPDAPIWDDVTTLDGKPFRGFVDIMYGGFPCQDISVAGKGVGLEGKRSGLFFEILRLAEEIEPPFIFLENVPAIRTRGLDRVGKELADRGYDCRWDTLSAYDVGAPHLRKRWFLLGYAKHYGRSSPSNKRSARKAPQLSSEKRENPICKPARASRLSCDVSNTLCGLLRDEQRRRCGTCGEGKADTCGERLGNCYGPMAYPERERGRRESQREQTGRIETLGGGEVVALASGIGREQSPPFGTDWWVSEPDVGRGFDGIADWVDGSRSDNMEPIGSEYEEIEERSYKILRYLRQDTNAETIQRALRGLDCFQAEEALLTLVREFEIGGRIPRKILESEATFETLLRSLRYESPPISASLRPGQIEQFFREYPNAMRELSQLVASRGKSPWDCSLWESTTPRVASGIPHRVDRIKALGNGVVPAQAREAFMRLFGL